jgi:ParB/Sulfiredoxin domain
MSASNALRLESWAVDRLIPSARNARTNSPAQVAEIAGSIRAFGFSNPILVSAEGDVIAGHGRLAAARQLGLQEVPVIVLSDLSELQRRQLLLADIRTGRSRRSAQSSDFLILPRVKLSAAGLNRM